MVDNTINYELWTEVVKYILTMDACTLVEREQVKIGKKLESLSGSTAKKLQGIIDQVAELKASLEGKSKRAQMMPTKTFPLSVV